MTNYDELMQRNLTQVFGERDATQRMAAIRDLYSTDAVLFEPHASAKGHDAISDAVTALLESLPPALVFTATGRAVGHHGVARLRWQSGPPNGMAAVTGTDVARIEDNKIHALYVFVDPARD